MTIFGLIVLIVILLLVIHYVPMPHPLGIILTVVAVVLGVALLMIVLQSVGLLPSLFDAPARIR